MDFFDIKRRSVHFIVKSALGRFLKHIDRNHIEGVVVSKAGMQFELVNMELNEVLFNEEILAGSPLRLVSGSVNSIRGTLGVFSNETRDLTIEGVDLTFDVIGNNLAREANTGEGLTGGGGTQRSNNTSGGGECGSFHSMASGPISRDEFRSEILGVQEVDDEQVSMGVSALSEAIKSLVHSITFTAEHVNVRLRFPPPNAVIVFGQPPPEGSVELLLSLPNRVTLSDVVNRTGSTHGNSFHKEIRFSGLRVALYDVSTRSTQYEVDKGVDVQHVKHSSIIFGGPVEMVENVLSLKFIDTLPGRDARWEVGLHLNELRSVISPTQLSRLGVAINTLLGAPDADDDAGSSKKSLPEESTDRFSLSCTAMSLALLQEDNDEEVGLCWKTDEGRAGSLSTPHYSISISRGAFQVLSSTPTTSPKDDPYHSLFDRFPGRSYSIALANFSVVERRPGPQYAPQTLLTFKNNSDGSSSSTAVSSKSLVCVVRTTCPMSVDSAKDVGVRIPQGHDFGMPISRMDVAAQLITDLELTVDVDILDRVVKFAAQVGQLFQAKQQLGTRHHRSNAGVDDDIYEENVDDYDGGDSPFDDFGSVVSGTAGFQKIPSVVSLDEDIIRPSLPPTRSLAVPVGSSTGGGEPVAAAFHQDPYTYYDDDYDRKEYLTLPSISLKAKQLTFHVKFPSAKKPDPDLYGPLTQQLFASLVTAMSANGAPMDNASVVGDDDGNSIFGAGLGGRSVVSSVSRWTAPTVRRGGGGGGVVDSHHLKKALLIEIKDLLVDLPDGSSSVVNVDGTSAAVYLLDVPTMVRGGPILKLLLHPEHHHPSVPNPSNDKGGSTSSSCHFCKVLLRPEVSAQTATTLVMHPELVKGHTLPPNKIIFNSASEEAVLTQQRVVTAGAGIDVSIRIERVTGRLHQDDLLLILFMVDEVLGCVSKASRRLDRVISKQDALAVADEDNLGDSCRTVPESAVAMNLSVRDIKVILWVPRLCANGKPAGQPLFMTLPAESQRNSATQYCLYHKYKIGANNLDVFLYSFTHSWLTGVTGAAENRPKTDSLINVSASFVMLAESLPPKAPSTFTPPASTPGSTSTPKWSTTVPLLTSYASVYNYIDGGDGPTSKARPLAVFVRRLVDLEQLQVDTTVNVEMNRISVPHQVAHVGDHWLLALLAFVGDAPVASSGSPNVSPQRGVSAAASSTDDSDGGESVDSVISNAVYTQPMTTVTRVTVNATKTLVDYQPFGYGCRIAAVIPVLRVETGDLFGHRPDARIKVFLQAAHNHSSASGDIANILFHHNFSNQLVNAESPKAGSLGSKVAATKLSNVSRNDVIVEDLRSLGFVQMLSLSSLGKGATIVIDIGGPEKPTKVQVRKLRGQFTCAKDSFQYFQIALSHYLGGLDAQFLPTPQMFVKEVAKGRHIIQSNLPAEPAAHQQFSVQMHIAEEEFEDRIRQCVLSEFFPNVRDDYTVTSNEDVFAGIYASPVAIPPSPEFDEDEGFDVISGEEGGLHPKWSWSKTIENLATYVGDGPTLASDMGLRLMDGGLMPAHRDEGEGISSNYCESDSTKFCLADFETKGHFAPKADALDAAFTRGFSLIGCPPVEVEVMLLRCEGTVKLYAGLDFTEQGSRRGKSSSYVSFSSSSNNEEGEAIEAICATIAGINAQIDVFREGFDLGMRAYVEVKDIEVEDRIAESEVRTLFMAAVPKEFRDPSSSMLELQWTTILPCSMLGLSSLQSSEEQLSLRLEPFVLSLHRRAIDMLLEFVADEEEQWKRLNIEVPPSTMYFNRLFIHPIVATVNVLFEVRSLSKALHGEVAELCHLLPSLEGSRVQFNEIDIRSCHINNLGERIVELLSTRMLTMNAIFLLLCGVQPVRAATEMGKASIGLLIQPLDHYKRNRSVYAGILRGVQAFSKVSAAELLKMGAGATRTAHNVTNLSTGTYSKALVRGSQPAGLRDGVMRATREVQLGVEGAVRVVLEGGVQETWRIPPIITDGFLKAFTEVLQGLRNNVSPSDMDRDMKLYKSHSKRAK